MATSCDPRWQARCLSSAIEPSSKAAPLGTPSKSLTKRNVVSQFLAMSLERGERGQGADALVVPLRIPTAATSITIGSPVMHRNIMTDD